MTSYSYQSFITYLEVPGIIVYSLESHQLKLVFLTLTRNFFEPVSHLNKNLMEINSKEVIKPSSSSKMVQRFEILEIIVGL